MNTDKFEKLEPVALQRHHSNSVKDKHVEDTPQTNQNDLKQKGQNKKDKGANIIKE